MATAYSNITKFSKFYQSNSNSEINQVFNLNFGSNSVKFAYLGSTLIYDYRGTGYFIGSYYSLVENPQTFKYTDNQFDASTSNNIRVLSYNAYNFFLKDNTICASPTTTEPNDYTTYGPVFYNMIDEDGTVNSPVFIHSYSLHNDSIQTYTTATNPIVLQLPRLETSYEIQNRIVSSSNITSTTLNTYAYLWNKNTNSLVNENAKIHFSIFQPRQSYMTRANVNTNYYASGDNIYQNGYTYLYYNISAEITCWQWAAAKNKYPYQYSNAYSYCTNYSENDFNGYVNNIWKVRHDNGSIYTNTSNEIYLEKSYMYSYHSGIRRVQFLYSPVHINYNGDTAYYYGVDKTFNKVFFLELDSYQHINDTSIELKTPLIHDATTITTKLALKPYILSLINVNAEGNDAGNWPDIRSLIFIKHNDDLYRLRAGTLALINSNGNNQDWLGLIYNNLSYMTKYRSTNYARENEYFIHETTQTGGIAPNTFTYKKYALDYMPSYIKGSTPPLRDFPTDEFKVQYINGTQNTYNGNPNKRFYDIVSTSGTYRIPISDNIDDVKQHKAALTYIIQNTEDIDGQNGLVQDNVLMQTRDNYTQKVYTNGVESTYTAHVNGNPYNYAGDKWDSKFRWAWHDEDIDVICVSYNANISTNVIINYTTYYGCDLPYNNTSAATITATSLYTYNTTYNSVPIKANISKFTHNLTVDHSYTRAQFDKHNHLVFKFYQEIYNN